MIEPRSVREGRAMISSLKMMAARLREREEKAAGDGRRRPLPSSLVKAMCVQYRELTPESVVNFTFEKKPSGQSGARADVVIYDASGKKFSEGREFSDGSYAFWR
jgi:hypothetical protein